MHHCKDTGACFLTHEIRKTKLLKPEQNPPISWPQEESIDNFTGQWWVAHTKSRNEKALAHDLISRQISYFLPMTWKIRRQKGRKIRSLLPLFNGYLFFCGSEPQRLETLRTHRIANLIEIKDQQKFLCELLKIQQAIKAGVPLEPHKYLETGQLCRVTAGPLAGLQGIVITTKGTAKLILQVDMLGQAASVEIDTDTIETVNK